MRRLFLKLVRRRNLHRDLEAEMEFHREMASVHGNAVPLGRISSLKEQSADLWRFAFLENLWRDIVYGVRGLRKNPALVFGAAVSLTLGIGANLALFSLAVEFLLSEPSVRDAHSVMSLRLGGNSNASHQVFEFLQASGIFADLVGDEPESFVNWNDGSETRPIFATFVTKNYFTSLGIPIAYGRGIEPRDSDEVVVFDYRFWRKNFNGDPDLIGRAINLEGKAYIVVGVLPASFRSLQGFGYSPDVYVPRYLDDTTLQMYARLKPGMTRDQTLPALRAVAARIDSVFPAPYKYTANISVRPLTTIEGMIDDPQGLTIGLFFALLLVVAGLVLLIACINVASLLLARASARRREIAVRLSLGAGRGRLLQQLLVESLLLCILGTGGGLILARAITASLERLQLPIPIPIHLRIDLDWRAAIYAAILTVAATVACGLLPAWQATKESIAPSLVRDRKMRLRRALVTGQVALSLVVLASGFLFLRNLFRASQISPGFDLRHTIRARVNLPAREYKEFKQVDSYARRGVRELEAMPGVDSAAAAFILPFNDNIMFVSAIKFPNAAEQQFVRYHWNVVTPDYFRAMGIPLLKGRSFLATDREGAKVVIVNRAFAESYLGGREPIGCIFTQGGFGGKMGVPLRIVGVVEGTKNETLGEGDLPQMYQPISQIENGDRRKLEFVVRSAIPPLEQLGAVRETLRRVEPNAGLEVSTLYSSIGFAILPSQVGAVLMGAIGLLGLVLASVGLYGIMAYSIARRTQEIGIRMALGAGRSAISKMVLGDAARLVLTGSAIGLAIAWFATQPLARFLVPGLKPGDPLGFVVVIAVLAATGLVASWGPLRRALSIDPASSLRYE
ncbi:MAG TPA: ABC transporter permease [Bryobacteraceae bacterium]